MIRIPEQISGTEQWLLISKQRKQKYFAKLINRKGAELTTVPITYLGWSVNSSNDFSASFSSVEKLKLIDMAFEQSNRLS